MIARQDGDNDAGNTLTTGEGATRVDRGRQRVDLSHDRGSFEISTVCTAAIWER